MTKTKCVCMLAVLVIAGCATGPETKYSEWRREQPAKAPAIGVVRRVDNVEVWDHGDPDRPYVVVALLEQDFPDEEKLLAKSEEMLAKAAQQHKADGLILIARRFAPKNAFVEWGREASAVDNSGTQAQSTSGTVRLGRGRNCSVIAYAIKYVK